MHTLFSRSRTPSTPKHNQALPPPPPPSSSGFLSPNHASTVPTPHAAPKYYGGSDEFGRVASWNSMTGGGGGGKKDKDKDGWRLRTMSNTGRDAHHSAQDDPAALSPLAGIPDGSFAPFSMDKPSTAAATPATAGLNAPGLGTLMEQPAPKHDYGYLSYDRHVILGVEQVSRLVQVLCDELTTRGGLTTPFVFSSLALDINSLQIKNLVKTFLDTCVSPSDSTAELRWREEARYAGVNELGMCLRWGLAKLVRVFGGQEVRGMISWDQYVDFRESEISSDYPPRHFKYFVASLIPPVQQILVTVLTLLSRLTAHSSTSGHTPPTLSPLFGPLIFGLGPATLDFHSTYRNYLRATTACEHLLLAFIRWQDTPETSAASPSPTSPGGTTGGGSASTLGVPARLKDWIRGYPSMLPSIYDRQTTEAIPQPRRGAKTTRVTSVRRNVRMYSPDLVFSSGTWGNRESVGMSREWERIAPRSTAGTSPASTSNGRMKPRYSEGYRKRMSMHSLFQPDTGAGHAATTISQTPSYASSTNTLVGSREGSDEWGGSSIGNEGEVDRFKTLNDLKWGTFMSNGFGGLGVDGSENSKLQFDLTEGARSARAQKRTTLNWSDFSSVGFSRTDEPLSATLQFSTPLATTVASWPSHSQDIHKKLKKTQKSLPAFGWDTEPVMGSETVVEEAFLDVFCDLVYGGGWMDIERVEEYDRECNWALVEFRSLPHGPNAQQQHQQHQLSTLPTNADPRTGTSLLLFEEFVPLEYRQQLSLSSTRRRPRLPSLFSSNKNKTWKQAPTLNGRPYIIGQHPKNPTFRELEFEGLLRTGSETKLLSASGPKSTTKEKGGSALGRVLSPEKPKGMTPTKSNSVPAASGHGPAISAPLYTSPRVEATASEPISGQGQADDTVPSNKRHGGMQRFRLSTAVGVGGVGGIPNRRAGMTPAEYSTLEFETRIASDVDDDSPPPTAGLDDPSSQPPRQRTKRKDDDAWVDILVGSQTRRMEEQAAQMRRNQADPNLASMEVAQVLAGMRTRNPGGRRSFSSEEGDMEPVVDAVDEVERVPRKAHLDDSGYHQYSSTPTETDEGGAAAAGLAYDAESATGRDNDAPRSSSELYHDSDEDQYTDDDDPNSARNVLRRARERRMQFEKEGYFSQHAERRPTSVELLNAVDPPAGHEHGATHGRLAYDVDSDEEEGEIVRAEPALPPKQGIRALPVLPGQQVAFPSGEEVYPDGKKGKSRALDTVSPTGAGQATTIQQPIPTPANGAAQAAIGGKTSALIEMYRQREQQSQQTQSPSRDQQQQASKIPVRVGPGGPRDAPVSPPKGGEATDPASHHPAAPAHVAAGSIPDDDDEQEDDDDDRIELVPPQTIPLQESGRASPARYVHGQPLHNVLEEEEE